MWHISIHVTYRYNNHFHSSPYEVSWWAGALRCARPQAWMNCCSSSRADKERCNAVMPSWDPSRRIACMAERFWSGSAVTWFVASALMGKDLGKILKARLHSWPKSWKPHPWRRGPFGGAVGTCWFLRQIWLVQAAGKRTFSNVYNGLFQEWGIPEGPWIIEGATLMEKIFLKVGVPPA